MVHTCSFTEKKLKDLFVCLDKTGATDATAEVSKLKFC